MKIKLFNGACTNIALTVMAGSYDSETSRVVLVVRGEGDSAGNVTLDVAEAHRVAAMITSGLPAVTRVPDAPVPGNINEKAAK